MNRIFKTLVLAATLLVGSTTFAAQYLWWTADTSIFAQTSYAKIAVFNGTELKGYLNVANSDGGGDTGNPIFTATYGTSWYAEQLAYVGSSYLNDGYDFICELYDSSGNQLASSDAIAEAEANLFESWSEAMTGSETEFTFVIPEPTSGMLALLGFGLLALRRKRA